VEAYYFNIVGGRRRFLGDNGENIDPATRSTIENTVSEFVRDHKEFLPTYSIPKHKKATEE
jgi:hypothetical protein